MLLECEPWERRTCGRLLLAVRYKGQCSLDAYFIHFSQFTWTRMPVTIRYLGPITSIAETETAIIIELADEARTFLESKWQYTTNFISCIILVVFPPRVFSPITNVLVTFATQDLKRPTLLLVFGAAEILVPLLDFHSTPVLLKTHNIVAIVPLEETMVSVIYLYEFAYFAYFAKGQRNKLFRKWVRSKWSFWMYCKTSRTRRDFTTQTKICDIIDCDK